MIGIGPQILKRPNQFGLDLFGDIFEPTGGGVSTVSTFRPGQELNLDTLTELLQGLIPQGLTPFTGQRVAGVSPLQQTGFGLAGGLAPGIGAGIDLFGQTLAGFDPQQAQGFLGQAGQALQRGTQPFDPQTIIDALAPARQLGMNVFEQDVVPFLSERFGATSRGSGAFNKALAEAGANLGLGLGGLAAGPIAQGALQTPGLQLQGAGIGGNLAQLPGVLAGQGAQLGGRGIQALGSLLGAGGLQRGIGQEQISGQMAQALDPRNILAQFLPLALGTQSMQAFQAPSGPSQFSQIASLFGGGGAFGTQGAFGPFTEPTP